MGLYINDMLCQDIPRNNSWSGKKWKLELISCIRPPQPSGGENINCDCRPHCVHFRKTYVRLLDIILCWEKKESSKIPTYPPHFFKCHVLLFKIYGIFFLNSYLNWCLFGNEIKLYNFLLIGLNRFKFNS